MPNPIDLAGQKFSRLTAINQTTERRDGRIMWHCTCECGNSILVKSSSLKSGNTKSCGCLDRDRTIERNKLMATHGMTKTKTFKSWESMQQRCFNKNARGFEYYGGSGVTVCKRWLGEKGFENFVTDLGERPIGKTLDRINPFGNYTPENCKWSTIKEQNNNTRKHFAVKKLSI